jgi:hypothetical protein
LYCIALICLVLLYLVLSCLGLMCYLSRSFVLSDQRLYSRIFYSCVEFLCSCMVY